MSSSVTWIRPYVSDPLLGQYWSHFTCKHTRYLPHRSKKAMLQSHLDFSQKQLNKSTQSTQLCHITSIQTSESGLSCHIQYTHNLFCRQSLVKSTSPYLRVWLNGCLKTTFGQHFWLPQSSFLQYNHRTANAGSLAKATLQKHRISSEFEKSSG